MIAALVHPSSHPVRCEGLVADAERIPIIPRSPSSHHPMDAWMPGELAPRERRLRGYAATR